MNTVEKRLCILVGISRKRKLKAGHVEFKQQMFIKTNLISRFEGIECGYDVCSLATLSRLENGKHNHDFALIDFFLKKLGIQYRIKESIMDQENNLLNLISSSYTKSNQNSLKILISNCEFFYNQNSENILLGLDQKAFWFICRVLYNEKVDRQMYEDLLELNEVYHSNIRDWLIGCGIWLRHNHPDFWDLNIKNEIFRNHFQFLGHEINYCFLSENNLSTETKLYIRYMTINDHTLHREALSEAALCLSLAKGEKLNIIGSSALFKALCVFNEMSESIRRLNFFSETIFDLLCHEPSHKKITKYLSGQILELCQHTKTYKPLIRLVELLNENTSNNLI